MPRSEQIPFEGVLNCWNDEHDLPDLLLAISRAGKTGRLHFSNPEGDKTLFVKEGRIVFAQSSSNDDGLGQFLLRTGQLSLMDYAKVTNLVQPGKRLGALLVEHGILEPKELVPAVRGQVRAVILGLFRRTETWYRFKDESLPPKEAITLDMPVAQLIVDGVKYVESWRRISKGVGDLESVYRLSVAGKKESQTVEVEGSVMELLEMLQEPVSLVQICQKATLPDFEACRFLWAFRSLDWIERAEAEESDTASDAQPSRVITAPAVTRPSLDSTVAAAAAETPAAGASKPATSPPGTSRPATPDPALVKTQVAAEVPSTVERQDDPEPSATPKPIPESLVQTKIAVERPEPPKPDTAQTLRADATGSPGPKPIPENLVQTRVAMEPPAPPAKTETREPPTAPPPSPPAPTPKPIPENLSSTQLYMSHPDVEPPEPAAPKASPKLSTQDRMEAILKGEDDASASSEQANPDASNPPASPKTRAPESTPEAPSPDSTQLFTDANALAGPGPNVEDSYADFTPSGFEALASGSDIEARRPVSGPATRPSVSPPETPAPSGPPTAPDEAMTSFGDLAYGDESFENVKAEEVIDSAPPPEPFVPHEPGPIEQPTVVEDVEVMDAEPLPTVEAVALPAEAEPEPEEPAITEAPSGMEAFVVPSPGDTGGTPQFATDDPMSAASTSDPPIPPPPKRRKTEEMDLDMDGLGHVFGEQ